MALVDKCLNCKHNWKVSLFSGNNFKLSISRDASDEKLLREFEELCGTSGRVEPQRLDESNKGDFPPIQPGKVFQSNEYSTIVFCTIVSLPYSSPGGISLELSNWMRIEPRKPQFFIQWNFHRRRNIPVVCQFCGFPINLVYRYTAAQAETMSPFYLMCSVCRTNLCESISYSCVRLRISMIKAANHFRNGHNYSETTHV